jgi:hypothetical protein
MKAVRLVETGKPLEEADVPIPEIGSSDVLIRVAAAGSVTRMRIIAAAFQKLTICRSRLDTRLPDTWSKSAGM